MNENAKKWVAALRSGEFEQTTGALGHVEDGNQSFCCLGVACILAEADGVIEPHEVDKGARGAGVIQYHVHDDLYEAAVLPDVVKRWLGLSDEIGSFDVFDSEEHDWTCLSEYNDHGATFEQIADLIEKEPKGLFVE